VRTPAVRIEVVEGDVLEFAADVLALKHADGLYGADEAAYRRLAQRYGAPTGLPQRWGEHTLVESRGAVAARHVIFVGLGPMFDIGYA
jgi:hypothetical protein